MMLRDIREHVSIVRNNLPVSEEIGKKRSKNVILAFPPQDCQEITWC